MAIRLDLINEVEVPLRYAKEKSHTTWNALLNNLIKTHPKFKKMCEDLEKDILATSEKGE